MSRMISHGIRIFIGLVLLFTSVGKLLDNRGFSEVIKTYQFYPFEDQLLFIALFISLFELTLSVSLLTGRYLKWAALGSVLLHGYFASLAALTIYRGIELSNCGCFGVFLARPLSWSTVLEDVFMTAISALLLKSNSK